MKNKTYILTTQRWMILNSTSYSRGLRGGGGGGGEFNSLVQGDLRNPQLYNVKSAKSKACLEQLQLSAIPIQQQL